MDRRPSRLPALAALALALGLSGAAHADPCRLIPDRGPMPPELRPGQRFEGPVVHVGDGDSLCVALGPARERWAEVRLADVYAPELDEPGGREAKAVLARVTRGRRMDCVARKRSYDRVVADCRVDGRPLGALLRAAGAPEGGRGRR